MNNSKHSGEITYEYSIEKARKILEEDGTILSDVDLKQLVNVLTLLAQQEAKLLIENKEDEGK